MNDGDLIAIEQPDGTLAILIPNWEKSTLDPAVAAATGKELFDMNVYIAEQMEANHALTPGQPSVVIPADGAPHDGDRALFREAWLFDAVKGVDVDMTAARAIKTGLIQAERDARLAALDAEYSRADGQGNAAEKTTIEARRQTLRDIPADIQADLDAISDPAALDAWEPIWP